MSRHPLPQVPFVEAIHKGKKQRPSAILLRSSFTTSQAGAALGVAKNWHQNHRRIESCHYVVDADKTFRCVWDNLESFHTQGFGEDPRGIVSINVCHDPGRGEPSLKVLSRVETLVAQLCLSHKIQPRYLEHDSYDKWCRRRWKRNGGIILNVAGEWPYFEFQQRVNDAILDLTGG